MLKSQSPSSNPRADGELCRNACGFYGNKIWDGFCSKCYREVYQQARHIQAAYDGKLSSTPDGSPTASIQSSPSFSNFQEKRRSNMNMRNPIRQMVNRAGSLRSTSNSVLSSLINDENALENEAASKHLDVMTTDDARLDIKSQVKSFANSFHKKCSNKNIHIDALIQEYALCKDTFKKRIQTNPIYRDENEDLILRVRDYLEKIVFSRDYAFIFNRIAIVCEDKDLSIQNRISSLHWITTHMLDTVLNENIPLAREAIYKAINSLIEIDSKTTPQGKIHSIMECKTYIEDAIRASSSSSGINADSFLPALIFIVLKAKPPRLHSNIQFLSQFSQPSGEQLYYLANLDSAVRFIELLQAQHLGLSSDDFSLYMRGEPVLPSKFVALFDSSLSNESNNEQSRKRFILYHELDHHCEKFDENLLDFNRHLTQTVTDVQELLNGTYARFPNFEKLPQLIDIDNNEQLEDLSTRIKHQKNINEILDQSTSENEQLPEPLAPEIVQQQTNNDS
ncbi:unnamed protein product [Rotaria magnacalcarata]|uniref:Rab5 GDP/GTP exchange factor n=1 Tax=Rotaria magnacalcarata TaxID=392030 RepID=A0A816NTL6_9BILA|nr:unnamed protein product [Rotaria magnacalcarata]CAF1671306.1 unnamed protein product [Rotaria magnacalcarata]CAF2040264.1 unnamed protein product [Rotaria magnacalcarata]CAF2070443.1 unnamed protein product [Rotaria magnacalcarata]CAF2116277.1 unnamed protein product [Rotaria magnacalcarata]